MKLKLHRTSENVLGPLRTAKDLIGIIMISYDFFMILQRFYKETMNSYDFLGPPRTSKDLQGPYELI